MDEDTPRIIIMPLPDTLFLEASSKLDAIVSEGG